MKKLSNSRVRIMIGRFSRWWPFFIVITLLCIGLVLRHPLLEQMAIIALVAITLLYAIFTHEQAEASKRMAEEMKLAREMQNKPYIAAYFEVPHSIMINLVIKNIGNGVARDVHLKIDPPLLTNGPTPDVAELPLFKNGISYFPPNGEFCQFIGTSVDFFGKDSKRPLQYNMSVSYCNVEGKPLPDQIIPLDVSVFYGLLVRDEKTLGDLVEEVKRLRQDFSSVIGTAYIQKGILVKTLKDLQREQEAVGKRLEKKKNLGK